MHQASARDGYCESPRQPWVLCGMFRPVPLSLRRGKASERGGIPLARFRVRSRSHCPPICPLAPGRTSGHQWAAAVAWSSGQDRNHGKRGGYEGGSPSLPLQDGGRCGQRVVPVSFLLSSGAHQCLSRLRRESCGVRRGRLGLQWLPGQRRRGWQEKAEAGREAPRPGRETARTAPSCAAVRRSSVLCVDDECVTVTPGPLHGRASS